MPDVTPKQLAKQLQNMGVIVATKLIQAGIDSPQKLKKLGAKKAYLRIHQSGGFCGKFHAAYLYGLEGAIRNCHWTKIPQSKKEEFRAFTNELREKQKNMKNR